MNKAVVIVLCLVLCLSLIGCSQSNLSNEAKSIGEKVVTITNQYLDGKESAKDVYEKISGYYDSLNAFPVPKDDTEYTALLVLQTNVLILSSQMSTIAFEGSTDAAIADLKKVLEDIEKSI